MDALYKQRDKIHSPIMTLAPDAGVEYYGSGSLDAIAN
jgi:hypothetical protein